MLKTIDIDLILQPTLQGLPITPQEMQARAASGDETTIEFWRNIWLTQYKENHDYLGSFHKFSAGHLYGKHPKMGPVIVCGSGPSLKESLDALRLNQELEHPVPVVSCLHNFGYFQDEGIKADYWISLDSGEIVLRDISEGRSKSDYWAHTEGQHLVAYTATHPDLIRKWQGQLSVFNVVMPDAVLRNQINEIENFQHNFSTGGNALGACVYFAKTILGAATIVYVGADFCFSYDNQFHSYKTNYDNVGQFVLHPDIYGIPRKTFPSYLNFKFWFDRLACTVPGQWVNASGGLLGAYLGGNLAHYVYKPLEYALEPYIVSQKVLVSGLQIGDNSDNKQVTSMALKDLWSENNNQPVLLF